MAIQKAVFLLTDKLEWIVRLWLQRKVQSEDCVEDLDEMAKKKSEKLSKQVNLSAFFTSTLIQASVIGHYFYQVFNHNVPLQFNQNCHDVLATCF